MAIRMWTLSTLRFLLYQKMAEAPCTNIRPLSHCVYETGELYHPAHSAKSILD